MPLLQSLGFFALRLAPVAELKFCEAREAEFVICDAIISMIERRLSMSIVHRHQLGLHK
jgi:hypothetical protein